MDEWCRDVDDIMQQMLSRSFVQFRDARAWQPATNVYESSAAYHICVELAGMSADDIHVQCEGDRRVTLFGQRDMPRPAEGELCIHVVEIDEGPFRREIDLPEPIDVEHIEADYNDANRGILWITLRKK